MRIDNNPDVLNPLKDKMTLVQKTAFKEILLKVDSIYLTGSHLYDTVHSRSDFDFYVPQSSVAPMSDFENFLGSLCSFEKDTASKYNNENNQTGDYFGNVVYKLSVGIDIQVVYEHRIKEKEIIDDAIRNLCSIFDINKDDRAWIMSLAVKKNRNAEKRAEREILGEDVDKEDRKKKQSYFVEEAIKRLNNKQLYDNNNWY